MITQDCFDSLPTADVNNSLPKGIHVIGAEEHSDPRVEELPLPHDTTWSYLFLQHMAARTFIKWLDRYNSDEIKLPYFIHKTYTYTYKNKEKESGVKKVAKPTVSGLVFLQGSVRSIQHFLATYYPQYHLVKNCSTGRPAVISDAVMRPFMNVMKTHPENITFLRDPFEKFAKDHVKLRVLTGPFKDYEGYIIRIDRDRQLVFDFGGLAVALRGVHKEDFEEV